MGTKICCTNSCITGLMPLTGVTVSHIDTLVQNYSQGNLKENTALTLG